MAILGTELTSNLSKQGTPASTLEQQRESTLHYIESLTGQGLPAGMIPSQLDTNAISPSKYIDNLPK